jgi:protein-tyrosine-phosphatase
MSVRAVLFLCTGNYYRSRFAEGLFNHLASQLRLGWRADSCGLALDRGETVNVGLTEGALKVAVRRLRQRYRELLRAEVAHTVAQPEEVDHELRHLIAVTSG